VNYVENNDVNYFSHDNGLLLEKLENSKTLKDEILVTSIAENDNGQKFVSSFESKKYPFYGV